VLDSAIRQVHEVDLEPVQLLRPDGTLHPDERYPMDLDLDEIGELHAAMVVTRQLDQEFINLQRQGQLALFPSCRGQEAAQVGSAAALKPGDWVFPQYRELGVLIHRGVDPVEIGHLWRGTRHGSSQMIERRCAPLCVPIATHALHAVGLAMGAALDGSEDLAIAYIGDGATSEGDAHEAFNFAGVFDAPCIFFVQNNQWAISVPLSQQTRSLSLAHKAVAYGIPGVRCDGNDVLATWAVTSQAAKRAREGQGPTLIEAVTYRMGAHTTSDDPLRYRNPTELAEWATRDPIARVRLLLELEGWWTDGRADDIAEQAESACAHLRNGIYDAPPPAAEELFAHVYVTRTTELERQAAQLRLELGGAGAEG
jgi:2-oxoisovalerate dehydrogenase E1 component alpha subunit